MKSVVLLTIALFLISAPAPDARDVAEMTANFIVPTQEPGLQASQEPAGDAQASSQLTATPGNTRKSSPQTHRSELDAESRKPEEQDEQPSPSET